MRLDEHVLHHIAGIDTPLEGLVHPQADHPLERLAMPVEQSIDGRLIPLASLKKQFLGLRRIGPHACMLSLFCPTCDPFVRRRHSSKGFNNRTPAWRKSAMFRV